MTLTHSRQSYTFYVNSMHCQSCVLLTEGELMKDPRISSATANLRTRSMEVCGDFGDLSPEEITTELSRLLSQHTLSIIRSVEPNKWTEFAIAIPITAVLVFLFVFLQKLGIVNLINTRELNYGTAFLIGIIASVSTCMAVVGGLVLSLSTTFAQSGSRFQSQISFHLARLIAFFILGGMIGSVGALIQLGWIGTAILNLIIGLVMLILGINLLDLFPWTAQFQPTMPKFFSRFARPVTKPNNPLTPILAGIATFFLPCGFTQSMQISVLSENSFLSGGLTMLAFALGTFPVLALMSFSAYTIKNSPRSGIFFKTVGLLIILFALFNILNGLIAAGWIEPLFNL